MIEYLFLIAFAALIMETIDSGLGMMYGTLLSPILIIAGFNPFLVVPGILLSQSIGGFFASYHHHKYKNAKWSIKSKDLKISLTLLLLGLLAVVVGVYVGTIISAELLKTYIGLLCLIMGGIVIFGRKFKFSWKKIAGIGVLSAFNKALSGGGYGPIVATGNIASGIKERKSIGITDFAEAPICLASFFVWIYFNGFPYSEFLLPLCIGAGIGGLIGPYLLSKVKNKRNIKLAIGQLAIVSGVIILTKLWLC